jgi:hypothetical protein
VPDALRRGRGEADHDDDGHLDGGERDRVQTVRVLTLVDDPDCEQAGAGKGEQLAGTERDGGTREEVETERGEHHTADDGTRRHRSPDDAFDDRREHDVETGDERGRRWRHHRQADGLGRVARGEQSTRDEARPQEGPGVLAVAASDRERERPEDHDGDSEAQHEVRERLDVAQRVVHQRKRDPEEERREHQRAFGGVSPHRG